MKIALIGLPQTGKKTVFSLMTGIGLDHLLGRPGEFHVGNVKVTDPRIDKLTAMYNPKKTRYAEIEVTLAPAPPHEPKPREQWLNKLKNMDAFCHIVRAFEDPAVFHAKGSVDALRDIDEINLELAISDLSLIETRLSSIAQENKKKFDQERADEAALLERLKPYLESGKSLREYAWHDGEEKKVRSLQFLTMKGLVVALNGTEPNPQLLAAAKAKVTGPRAEICELSAKTEAEVAQIEDPKERAEFLTALGITEPALHVLTRQLYQALGYISFFTTGEDEVRAWTIRHGATAVEAAYAIHSDIARNFIRAETMKYEELVSAATGLPAEALAKAGHAAEVKLKETGRLLLKGKDYIVEDGDIVHIRHSG
ncbi:MAG: Ribosome-binding ATPase YchF [Verrucomicrobiae bacterium]|nr:Ribosome-binding ATPase YchF [Verrucomicrobiae bacterium]